MGTIEKAIELAARHHAGQVDKEGSPYILHPLRLLLGVAPHGVETQTVAVLHDTLGYVLSYKFLVGQLTEEQYRSLMAAHG